MSYQVLARKWRPQTFEAVVGQDAITRTLKNALDAARVAHAYLFAGPRGVGKTTTARLLARALLCPERKGAEPCGACVVCRESLAGNAVDILEIDGASNRGIEEIRTLRENVKYAPSRGRYKVYIIDEVHQLTEAAFNALLKTLEEPPAHIVFILATTDPRDIPATVLSRVQRFDFRPIAADVLVTTLERILGEEGVPFDPAALPVVVRAAEGSLRDALSLLDTAIAYGSGRVDAATVASLLGATTPVEVRAFARALVAHESAAALEAIDRAVREGEDLQAFVRDVIELLRQAMVLKAAPTAQLADLTPAEGNELRKLGEAVSLDEILYIVRAFLEADALMRESPHPRVELEIAAVRATRRPVPQALEEVLRRVDEAEARWRQVAPRAAPAQETLLPAAAAPSRPQADIRLPMTPPAPSPSARSASAAPATIPRDVPSVPPREPGTAAARMDGPATPVTATGWQLIVEDVMKKKPTVGAVLMHARPGALTAGELTVVLTGNHFHRELLADRANRDLLVQAVRRHVAGAQQVSVISEEGGGASVTEHPAIQAAVAEFQGEVVAVRPRSPEGEGQ
jgi:DNA polymerase-3 subunit gamma/tau